MTIGTDRDVTPSVVHTVLVTLYFAVLLLLASFGLHRSHLVYLCWRHRKRLALRRAAPTIALSDAALPHVTIQLPLYNEATVAARLLEAVSRVSYPRDRLEVQVLDDSTDETAHMVRAWVERYRSEGHDFVYIHRTSRVGYKAGALDAGLRVAKGSLIAIFDADFIPQPEFLRACVPDFGDPAVGMVQARWGHLNRGHSLLTQVQALMLDGHHLVENRARWAAGTAQASAESRKQRRRRFGPSLASRPPEPEPT